jgi:hypothetical protein
MKPAIGKLDAQNRGVKENRVFAEKETNAGRN